MGEAKRRGTFEERKKQALNNIKRGIITTHGKVSVVGERYRMNGIMPDIEMLYLSLYWDEIIIPTGILRVGLPFEQDLIKYGVLTRPDTLQIPPSKSSITADGSIKFASHEVYAFGEIAKQKIDVAGEDWVIQHFSEPTYMPEHRNEQNNIRLRISNILPIPSITETFNLEDLLEFKYRRKDQLGELHQSMDELLRRIYVEPIPAIKESELKRFENAVKELDKPLIERFKVIRKSDWEVSLSPDIPTILEKTPIIAGAIATDGMLNMDFPVISSIASIASILSLTRKYSFTFNQFAKEDIKLEYIAGAKSENIIL